MKQESRYSRRWPQTDAEVSRRDFVRCCAACGLGLALCPAFAAHLIAGQGKKNASPPGQPSLKETLFWEPAGEGRVKCTTCPNHCVRDEGGTSLCNARINKGGKLYSLTYGKPCYLDADPLTKNPLYHVAPGAEAIGIATAGCNLSCKYCQNWSISQVGPGKTTNIELSPADAVAKAKERKLKWITFSYTEPTVYLEYALEIARLAKESGIKVATSTSGYICEKPLEKLMENVDAFSVTLKGYTPEFYRNVCGGNIDDVWKSIKSIAGAGKWMEIVTLIVPGMNDADDGLKSLAASVAKVSVDIPLHFPRFAPAFKLQHLQQAPVAMLERARSIAMKEGLKYVYLSLSGHEAANSYCPGCKKIIIERAAFKVLKNNIKDGRCGGCSYKIPGLWAT
ncbi:MAG: AmmeMemoRadiSam system radical SAM enzyme [Verrucomicrobia bacterium]|nr:AmmeMemoRadiSam system radical SAM enzyme [Verrucomicrobiota bacterium]